MKWSYRIARVAGIDVRLHATFLLLLAFWGWQGYESGGTTEAAYNVLFVSLLFLCVLLHEFGHAFAARSYGIHTPDITLYPIGGVARLERMPENPAQELVIAVAGPAVNVVIGLVLWLALGLPAPLGHFNDLGQPGRDLAFQLLSVNVMLIVFNLIPAFPMDGGRVLRALLSMRLGHTEATSIAARIGQGIAVLFAIVGIFGIPGILNPNFFLLFIAMFVFMAAQQEAAYAGMRAAVAGMRIGDAMITRFQTLLGDMPVATAAEEALHDTQPIYAVTDDRLRVLGMLSRNDLLIAANSAPQANVASLAQALPTVTAEGSFDEAFRLMQASGSPVLPVVNPAGQIVGLISLNLLRERAQMRREAGTSRD
jgi:Zn-dependent protease